ncbi:MAG: hypothetical protein HOV76_18040 [Hamadaea sp.]|nr:hypothetical protein [Hamadaea sp.]
MFTEERRLAADAFWRRLAGPRVLLRSGSFGVRVARHAVRRPYRQGLPSGDDRLIRRRIRAAVYDSVVHLLLDAYAEIDGVSLQRRTGPILVRLNRMLAAFDDAFESRLGAGSSLSFPDVFADHVVQERMDEAIAYLIDYPEGPGIREYLNEWVNSQYAAYVALATRERVHERLDDQLELARVDSGGLATCFANCVGLVQEARPSVALIDQFTSLGLLGKIADDVVDFWDDLRSDRINIVRGVLHRSPTEEALVLRRAGSMDSTSISWWRHHCPATYVALSTLLADYRRHATAPSMTLAADLMLLPARWGRTVIRAAPVGLRN